MKLKSIITVCILLTTSYSAISAWKRADVKAVVGLSKALNSFISFNEETGVIIGLDISDEEDIFDMDLSSITFQQCNFEDTHLTRWILTGCKFLNCNCKGAHFNGCYLDEAVFDGKTKIEGAYFDDASLIDATIEALCINCHFQWANLKGARVVYVSKSDFEHANLKDADFGGALLLKEMDWFIKCGAKCNKPR